MKVTDRPVVVLLAAVVAAFLAGISTYAFFRSRVGEAVESFLLQNRDKLPRGPEGPPGPSVPIGTIVAWHQDLPQVPPELPVGWIPCNGQRIDDKSSPLHGQSTPNLNGEGRFLRGSTTSGLNQESAIKKHFHPVTLTGGDHEHGKHALAAYGTGGDTDGDPNGARPTELVIRGGGHTHSGKTEEFGSDETRPLNMSVVWIMRIR